MTKEEWDRECDAARPKVRRRKGVAGGHHPANWPQVCHNAGVHPSRQQEAIDDARAKGVPTDFTRESGDVSAPVFTSAAHRDAYLKAYKMHDRNGGYTS